MTVDHQEPGDLPTPDEIPTHDLTSPRAADVRDAVRTALGRRATLIVVREMGAHVELSIPDGFGGRLRAEVYDPAEGVEYALAWAAELGLDASGGLAPRAGMRATRYVGSDCYACVVERVSPSGKTIWIEGRKYVPSWSGGWTNRSTFVRVGVADSYQDPSF